MSTDSVALAQERLSLAARRSIIGGVITLFIDSYDIYFRHWCCRWRWVTSSP
jgi:hypothetical protein